MLTTYFLVTPTKTVLTIGRVPRIFLQREKKVLKRIGETFIKYLTKGESLDIKIVVW